MTIRIDLNKGIPLLNIRFFKFIYIDLAKHVIVFLPEPDVHVKWILSSMYYYLLTIQM